MPTDKNKIPPHLVHSHDIHLDNDYTQWLVELKNRYRSAQIKAAVKVNAEKLLFNWQLGRDLVLKKAEERWGAGVVEQVSLDLQREYPDEKGFSARNLWWMKQWYLFYTSMDGEKLNQFGAELKRIENQYKEKLNQLGSQIHEFSGTDETTSHPFPPAFGFVPWRHHVVIMQKCQSVSEALFYIHRTISEGWSRQTLESMQSMIFSRLIPITQPSDFFYAMGWIRPKSNILLEVSTPHLEWQPTTASKYQMFSHPKNYFVNEFVS